MSRNTKISIITINYNNDSGLERTIKSIEEQKSSSCEFIVIDGGSNDNSLNIINKYKSLITSFVSEKDKGIYNAMNKGIDKATGDYILFLNSGDYFYDNTILSKNIQLIKDFDLIAFDINLYGEGFNIIHKNPDKLSFSFIFLETLSHQSVFIKRELFKRIGYYDDSLEIVADWKFFIHAIMSGCSYKNYNITLSSFEFGGVSTTGEGVKTRIKERERVIKNEFPFFYEGFKGLEDYKRLSNLNRFKLLKEIEHDKFGKKLFSILFRIYILFFSRKKIKNILK
ncbi:glycosyltransferase family 2 protein [Polaribacter atrinae]|uniref:glycosyltransferase family 2 protein n=1 Tax=Polaribacter atrinae TaxID=1333662 RepID=UPI0030F56A5E